MPTIEPREETWRHRKEVVNGLRLHYVEAGAGPPVILLHGFPEFWYSWRHQIPALAAAGFHVLAPDLRGYNESDKPAGVENYRLEALISDVVGLIGLTGAQRAVVVGHDWGGAIAWKLAIERPDLVEKLIILNAPHPGAFLSELRNPVQWLRSSYMLFFQLPWLPEKLLARRRYAFLSRVLRGQPERSNTFSTRDVERYKEAMSQPGALTAALNYYRALLRFPGGIAKGFHPLPVPTLLIWGEQDAYLGSRLTRGLERWVPHLQIVRLPNASHWVQNDAAEEVNRLMLEFLGKTVATEIQ